MSSTWTRRHLIGLEGLSPDELEIIFQYTDECLEWMTDRSSGRHALKNKCVANLFFEDSTRTRNSFSRAAQLLGADLLQIAGEGSSTSKGESEIDTARNIEAMGVDVLVVRHKSPGVPKQIADAVKIRVINAGDGRHEHPTQGLLDIYTLRRHFGSDLSGRTMAIVGDISNSRVARSNVFALTTLGAKVILCGPPWMVPRSLDGLGVEVSHQFDEVLPQVDAVMMLRVQFERMSGASFGSVHEYRSEYALTEKRAELLPDHALIMHPGPINRGLELDAALADGERSVIMRQVTHGVAVRMAVLRLIMSQD